MRTVSTELAMNSGEIEMTRFRSVLVAAIGARVFVGPRSRSVTLAMALLFLALPGLGCGDEGDLCQAAEDHVAQCLGAVPRSFPEQCTAEIAAAANDVLELPCDQIASRSASSGWLPRSSNWYDDPGRSRWYVHRGSKGGQHVMHKSWIYSMGEQDWEY